MISVILPSVRPDNLWRCLNAVDHASRGINIETIIVADFKPIYIPISAFWIYAPERKGTIDAINKGFDVSQGEYIFVTSDEAILGDGALVSLENMCKFYDNKVLLSPAHVPDFPFFYYKKWFAAFPFAHRSLIDKVGGLFDPVYKSFYADPDLSLRAYTHGFDVRTCDDAIIYHPNNMECLVHKHNVSTYLAHDRAIFKERWAHLGEFIDP